MKERMRRLWAGLRPRLVRAARVALYYIELTDYHIRRAVLGAASKALRLIAGAAEAAAVWLASRRDRRDPPQQKVE